MAKLHSALTNAELHDPKGITAESTASMLALNQTSNTITASADFVPSTTHTYDLGSTSHVWQEIYVATSSINFVDPAGTIIQQIKATDSGITFTSGSGAVANISGSIISGSALHIQGNAKVTGDLTLGGQITLGDADSDDVVFEAEVSSSLIPNNDNAFDLGSSGKQWKDIYVNGVGYIDSLGTDGDPVTAYINAGEIDGVTLGAESAVGNITSNGTITGSAVYGTTLGQNRVDGVKTITIEANSTVNQDLTTDAAVTFATVDTGQGANELYDMDQNVKTDSAVTFAGVTSTSDIVLTGQATDIDLIDNTTSALTFDAGAGGTSVLSVHTNNSAEAVEVQGVLKTSGILSGSSDAFFGQYGVNYVSASAGSLQATNYISGSEVKAPTGTFGTATISAGTITGITDITVADGGTGASSLTDGGVLLGSGTDAITAMGVLSDGEMIVGDGSTDPVAESGATLRTSIGVGTGDNVTFTNITGATISGSAVYGTTIGQNTGGGLKTISIEANSVVNQDLSSDAAPTFAGLTSTGDITITGQATDVDLIDNNASALSFDASGKAGILEVVTTDGSEKVKMSGGLEVTSQATAAGGITGSTGHFTEIKHNTGTGLHQLTLNEDLTVSDGQNVVLAAAGQANTFTMNESLTVGDGNSGTITYSAASKTLTVEDSATVDQDLTKDANPQFNNLTLAGSLTAQELIVSSSVTNVTQSYSSGSTIFGDTNDDTHVFSGSLSIMGNTEVSGNITAHTDSVFAIGASGTQFTNVFTDNVTLDGQGRIDLDDDLDTSIRASDDDIITFEAAGADQVAFTDGTIEPTTNDDIALGTTSKMFSDLFLGSEGVINWNNGNMSLSHAAGKVNLVGGDLVIGYAAGGNLRVTGDISGSGDLFIGDVGGNSISSSDSGGEVIFRNTSGTTHISGSQLSSSKAVHTSISGVTSLTADGNLDIGSHDLRAATLTADGLTATRVVFAGTDGVLSHDSDMTFATDTLTVTKIGAFEAAGAINFGSQNMTSVDIDSGTIDGVSNVNSTGTITGSAVYGTTLGQNTGGGVKTISIEANSIINQDVSSDADVTFGTIAVGGTTITGDLQTSGLLSGSGDFVVGTLGGNSMSASFTGDVSVLFRNSSGTTNISGSSVSASIGLFTTATITGGTITGITDLTVADGGTGASSFTDGHVLLGSGTGAITALDVTADGAFLVGDGTTDPVAESGNTARTSLGVGTGDSPEFTGLTLSGDLTVQGGDIVLTNNPTEVALKDNATGAIVFQAGSGGNSVLSVHTVNSQEAVEIKGRLDSSGVISGSSDAFFGHYGVNYVSASGGGLQTTTYVSSSRIEVSSGTKAAPSIRFTSDGNSGFFLESADDIGVALAGEEEFRFANGGTFHADADIVAYSSTVASDMRLKENITDTKYGLDTVMQLRGVEYDWKREDMGHDVGVLAQEVEAVIPELVKEHEGLNGKGSFKSVDYNKLVPILIESIKELKIEVDSLKVLTEVEELKD